MIRFKMLARDVNSNPTQYRTWVVNNTPDYTGALYTGPKSGTAPFVDVSAYVITDDNVVADFGLPTPTDWLPHPYETITDFPIRKVLPFPAEDSQVAVIDGYIYMFGGKITSSIYMASVANPADWVDTGATLPGPLYGSNLAIVDGYIYLFGGNNGFGDATGGGQVDIIYTAPVSNPLSWANTGATLPRNIQYSSLGMYDGYLYLFGGLEVFGASNLIFSASTANPTDWSLTGSTLPTALFGSNIAQIDGYWWLFGGATSANVPSHHIWKASVTNPTSWALDIVNNLPYTTSFSKFFTTGGNGYIIGLMTQVPNINNNFDHTNFPILDPTGFTPILQSNLTDPGTFRNIRGQNVPGYVPGVLSHSQVAIIYDRVWFFGGSGETAVFACNQELKYTVSDATAIAYANSSRVALQSYASNLENPFQILCFPYWLTDYQLTSSP